MYIFTDTKVINFCFFFSSRRRHTRYWRDWSSDVCSSDLRGREDFRRPPTWAPERWGVLEEHRGCAAFEVEHRDEAVLDVAVSIRVVRARGYRQHFAADQPPDSVDRVNSAVHEDAPARGCTVPHPGRRMRTSQ